MSISSDSSEASHDVSDYTPEDGVAKGNEETDTDDVKVIDKRPKKRARSVSPFHSDE